MSLIQSIFDRLHGSPHPDFSDAARSEVFFTREAARRANHGAITAALKAAQVPSAGRGRAIFSTPKIGLMNEDEMAALRGAHSKTSTRHAWYRELTP